MFRCNLYNFHYINTMYKAYFSTSGKEKWQMFISVYLERKPVISKVFNELESDFSRYLYQVELEKSLLSDHEIRNTRDKKQAILLKNAEREDIHLDSTTIQTAQDFEDACNEELSKFKFADRITDADKKNDTKSIKRKLDKSLALLVEQQIGDRKFYLPPQTIRKEEETLRRAAERILTDISGTDFKAQIYGNAPVGFYKYKYPKNKEDFAGAKVFVYFARYLNGNIKSSSHYQWLDRNEMKEVVPGNYYKSLQKFLIDEC